MYGGVSPQAYDRATTVFSPDGRIFQVEYAKEAVKRGATALGIATKDAVIMAALKTLYSPLVVEDTVKKVHVIDEHLLITSSGWVADARRLADLARDQAQRHRVLYGEKPPVIYVAKYIADVMHIYTQYGGGRPFGVSLLVGGFDSKPRLYELDPSGALTGYKADSIGEGKAEADSYLEKHYKENMSLDKALTLAVETLVKSSEKKPKPEQIEVAYIAKGKEGFVYLSDEEKAKYLKKARKR